MKVQPALVWARGMLPILGIALAVVVMGTVTGFAWDRVHRATADESVPKGVESKTGPDGTQVLEVPEWGVKATLPLAPEFPLVSFALHSDKNTLGLSSADLMKVSPACRAGANALGSVLRYPAGSYGASMKAVAGANVVATVGEYDYIYQFPQNACANHADARVIINRETAVVLEALGSLSATQP